MGKSVLIKFMGAFLSLCSCPPPELIVSLSNWVRVTNSEVLRNPFSSQSSMDFATITQPFVSPHSLTDKTVVS